MIMTTKMNIESIVPDDLPNWNLEGNSGMHNNSKVTGGQGVAATQS